MTIEMTEAKIGRSMKKCEMPMARPTSPPKASGRPPALSPSVAGVTLMPGRARIRPFTMTRSFGSMPFRITRKLRYRADRASRISAARCSRHRRHRRTCESARCRSPSRARAALRTAPTRHAHAGEHARREQAVGFANTARPRIVPESAFDHVVDEIHLALVLEVRLVEQPKLDRRRRAARIRTLAASSASRE